MPWHPTTNFIFWTYLHFRNLLMLLMTSLIRPVLLYSVAQHSRISIIGRSASGKNFFRKQSISLSPTFIPIVGTTCSWLLAPIQAGKTSLWPSGYQIIHHILAAPFVIHYGPNKNMTSDNQLYSLDLISFAQPTYPANDLIIQTPASVLCGTALDNFNY